VPSVSGTSARPLNASEQEWLRVREYLQEHRNEKSGVAAGLYPDVAKVAGTALLTTSAWLPDWPIPLQDISLHWTPQVDPPEVTGAGSLTGHLRPRRSDGSSYPTYSAAMAELAAPKVFENRSTYRLLKAQLTNTVPSMTFEGGTYFDGIDVGEACAHELAAAELRVISKTPLRDAVGNPCDPTRRPTNVAITALTLRHDRKTGEATFPLHWRDPAKVGHAGGLYMLMPVGIFQPTGDQPWHRTPDFSLWRCLIREYSEELLGEPERDPGSGPIDYDAWPLAASMTSALTEGLIRAHCLGMGVDPLTFATDLLTVVVFDAEAYDELFGSIVESNTEGRLVTSPLSGYGADNRFPFTGESVERLTQREPLQAAGAALLRIAWDRAAELLLSLS
jgi:hypothetical protein